MNPIYYIIRQLKDYGFTDTEITAFLTVVYTCIINTNGINNHDIESTIASNNNRKFIDVFYLVEEDLFSLPISYWKEWYNSLP